MELRSTYPMLPSERGSRRRHRFRRTGKRPNPVANSQTAPGRGLEIGGAPGWPGSIVPSTVTTTALDWEEARVMPCTSGTATPPAPMPEDRAGGSLTSTSCETSDGSRRDDWLESAAVESAVVPAPAETNLARAKIGPTPNGPDDKGSGAT